MDKGLCYITRRLIFSSAHCLHHPDLDNEQIYGQCANLHGHNYILEVTVAGKVDPITGFVIDLKDLKDIMNQYVKKILDHKNLNEDVPIFQTQVQSAENITIFIWNQLVKKIPKPAFLYCIKLHETENNIIEYFG